MKKLWRRPKKTGLEEDILLELGLTNRRIDLIQNSPGPDKDWRELEKRREFMEARLPDLLGVNRYTKL